MLSPPLNKALAPSRGPRSLLAAVEEELSTAREAHGQLEQQIVEAYATGNVDEARSLRVERDLIEQRLDTLESDRTSLREAVEVERKARSAEDWKTEIAARKDLEERLAAAGAAIEKTAHALAEAWNAYEDLFRETQAHNNRLPAQARQYGRDPLPPLSAPIALGIPGSMLPAIKATAAAVLPRPRPEAVLTPRKRPPRAARAATRFRGPDWRDPAVDRGGGFVA